MTQQKQQQPDLQCIYGTEDEEALKMRVVMSVTGAATCLLMRIGDTLGLYQKLKELGACTPQQLADAAGLSERWVREWLHQQASARMVSADAEARRFWLTPAQANVLVNEYGPDASPYFSMGLAAGMPNLLHKADKLCECFRTGLGLHYDEYGQECACATHRELSVWVRAFLVDKLCSIPGLRDKLEAGVAAADVGCGCGEALCLLAKAFPKSTFHGYDTSKHALEQAERMKAKFGVTNVTFHNPDDGPTHQLPPAASLHLVLCNDSLHDMTRPDLALRAIRGSLKPDGALLICDWRSAGTPAGNIKDYEPAPMMYGFSVAVCMSSALSAPGGLGLGTLGFSEAVARRMTAEAGFSGFQVLDFGSELNAHYLVTA